MLPMKGEAAYSEGDARVDGDQKSIVVGIRAKNNNYSSQLQ
jgi:hypothetical protein